MLRKVLAAHTFGPAGAPALLALHGVTNHGRRWRHVAGLLPEWRVIAPDLRGHGDSTWDPPWDAGRHVDDLVALMDAHGVERAPVVGHSFGGLLALHLAARVPHRVAWIALIDPAVALDPPRAAREAEAVVADPGWATVEEAREARRALRPPHSRDTVDADLAVFLRPGADGRLRLHFSRAAAAAAWGVMAEPPPDLTAYAGEVLLVVAGRVDVVTRALREALARGLGPRLTTAGIDAGHMLIIDAAQEVSALVRDFGSA